MPGTIRKDHFLTRALARIERRLRPGPDSRDGFVRALGRYLAASRGKRLRAQLTLWSARAVGRATIRVERLAAGLELFHQATLVHDDVIDGSRQRRHRATVNARFGDEIAVLVGDWIFSNTLELLARDMPPAIAPLVARAATAVCLGEIQERRHAHDLDMTQAHYLSMVGNKTASLLSACCEGGALLAGATPGQQRALARFGHDLGLAFQIRDDLLDLTGRAERLGKPLGQDASAGAVTLPVILALRRCRGRDRSALRRHIVAGRLRTPGARVLLAECGALALAGEQALGYARRAKEALRPLPENAAKTALLELADFAATRDH